MPPLAAGTTDPHRPMTTRTARLDELFRQEITAILARDLADPRIGFATVTAVETAPDLGHARVWVSIIGRPEEREATLRALQGAMVVVRRELGLRLHLKRIPRLHVQLDPSIERGTRVLQILNELEAGRTPAELPVGETLPTPTPSPTVESADQGRGARERRRGGGSPTETRSPGGKRNRRPR